MSRVTGLASRVLGFVFWDLDSGLATYDLIYGTPVTCSPPSTGRLAPLIWLPA